MTTTTSVTLLRRLRCANDQSAWARFVDLYTPLIFAWGRRAGLTEPDAADLSQDVLIHLLAELAQFDYAPHRGRFRGWLRTVTVNKCRERQRRKRLAADGAGFPIDQFPDENPGPSFWEHEFQQRLVARALQISKTDFEPRVWQAAWKQIVDDESPANVASELGLSLSAVYQARSRVLRRLREQLQELIEDD